MHTFISSRIILPYFIVINTVFFFSNYAVLEIKGLERDAYFLQPSGNLWPRLERSNGGKGSNIDEMGKFFMKASKSVPRIGRRNKEWNNDFLRANDEYDNGEELIPHRYLDSLSNDISKDKFRDWQNFAQNRESYRADLSSLPNMFSQDERILDDNTIYNARRFRDE